MLKKTKNLFKSGVAMKTALIMLVIISFLGFAESGFCVQSSATSPMPAESAIKELLKKVEKLPEDYFLNVQLGWNYYLVGKYANALYHYDKALKKNPWSFEPRMGFYNIYMARMDYQLAETACREILKIDPINYYGALYLSRALTAQAKYGEAKQVLTYILSFFPSDPLLNEQYLSILAKEAK